MVQTLHIGPYDDEGPVLEAMHHEFIVSQSLTMTGKHHEIHLSDARRTAPEKLKTILRQPVLHNAGWQLKPAGADAYISLRSNISVTSAAMGERSDRVSVTWPKRGWPLSVSTTATTPSCLPTRRLSR